MPIKQFKKYKIKQHEYLDKGYTDHSFFLPEMIFYFPTALMTLNRTVQSPLPSHTFFKSSKISQSSSGSLRSDFKSPSSLIKLTKQSSSMSATSYSFFSTIGILIVAEVGAISSYLLLVKISFPTMVALADPCFPGLAVEQSDTLHGKPFNMQQPPFLTDPTWHGVVSVDPASPPSNCPSQSDIELNC